MYKVMIVDDEPTIREGLKTIIPWEEYGFQVVDTAANGKEALQKSGTHPFDLIVVDIRMPGMDGLRLIEEIRKVNASIHILILSGYADFSYARKAIIAKVDGYILKPVDEAEMIEHLIHIRKVLAKEAAEASVFAEADEWNREQFVRSLVFGENVANGEEVQRLADRYDLRWKTYQIILIGLEDSTQDLKLSASLKTAIAARIGEQGVVFSVDPYIGILQKEDVRRKHVGATLYEHLAKLMEQSGAEFLCAAGPDVKAITDIADSYEIAAGILQRRFYFAGGRILTADDAATPGIPEQAKAEIEVEQAAEKLLFALEIGSVESIRRLVSQWVGQMVAAESGEQKIKTVTAQIASHALGKLTMSYPEAHMTNPQYANDIMNIYRQKNIFALQTCIVAFMEKWIAQITAGSTGSLLKKMVDLIHRSYDENMKLETLAEVFNYNSAYLGKLFKNYTGEYFNTFLDKVRIEEAKRLLEQGYKVYQVAERVGYANVDYFHSKFRKYVGMSPSTYRKTEK